MGLWDWLRSIFGEESAERVGDEQSAEDSATFNKDVEPNKSGQSFDKADQPSFAPDRTQEQSSNELLENSNANTGRASSEETATRSDIMEDSGSDEDRGDNDMQSPSQEETESESATETSTEPTQNGKTAISLQGEDAVHVDEERLGELQTNEVDDTDAAIGLLVDNLGDKDD